MMDIFSAFSFNYKINDTQSFKQGNFTGNFFPEFFHNLDKYVYKVSPALLDKIWKLREKSVKIFIASNSMYVVGDIIMNYCVGKDWKSKFDFAIYETKKPRFFDKSKNTPKFYTAERKPLKDFNTWMFSKKKGEEKILLEGHAEYLNQFFRTQVKQNFKILFFGDTIVSDCVYAFDRTNYMNWDIVLILEELQELENGVDFHMDVKYWKYWGSALYDKGLYSGVEQTLIFDFACNIAHRTFSHLDSDECHEFLSI